MINVDIPTAVRQIVFELKLHGLAVTDHQRKVVRTITILYRDGWLEEREVVDFLLAYFGVTQD